MSKRYSVEGMDMVLDTMVMGGHVSAWRREDQGMGETYFIRLPDTPSALGDTYHFPVDWLREEMVKADPLNAGEDLHEGYTILIYSNRIPELFTLLANNHDKKILGEVAL